MQAIALATTLALGPNAGAAFAPRTAEVIEVGPDVQIHAYDGDGELVAMLGLWIDPQGQIHATADYGAEWSEVVIDGDEIVSSQMTGLPSAEFEDRAKTIERLLYNGPPPTQASWLGCGLATASTIVACAGATILCPFGAIASACACLPELIDEFEDLECP